MLKSLRVGLAVTLLKLSARVMPHSTERVVLCRKHLEPYQLWLKEKRGVQGGGMTHVHVYEVSGLTEHDIDASDMIKATEQALEEAGRTPPGKSNCRYIAVVPSTMTQQGNKRIWRKNVLDVGL